MKKSLFALLLLPIFAIAAQSPFDGTWKLDIDKIQLPDKPEIWAIQNGVFQCPTCDPPTDVKADGTDQPRKGSKTIDTTAIKVVDNKTVEFTDKKGGKIVHSEKHALSADGKTDTIDSTDYPEGGKPPVAFKATYVRVAPGPARSHALSGSWRIQKVSTQGGGITITYKSTPNGLIMTSSLGESVDAKFDGKDYPNKSAAGGTISMTKINDRSFDSTNKIDGKVVTVTHLTVSADGKTITAKSENKAQGTTATFILIKQ